jgi:predicted Zn-dependent peptidase
MDYQRETLKNGMRVIVAPMKGTRAMTLLVLIGTGSKYESRKTNGLAHFLEHMFFKGTKTHPKPGSISKKLDMLGAEYNAFTSAEETGYWVKADAAHFKTSLGFVADMLQDSLLKKEEIEKERGPVIEELKRRNDTPTMLVWEEWETLLYGDQPAGWPTIGNEENIRSFTRDDFLRYWKEHYLASNAVVVMAGNTEANGDAMGAIEAAFRTMPKGNPKQRVPIKDDMAVERLHIHTKDTDQSHLTIGGYGFSLVNEKDRLPAELLATIMGGYMSSRLWQAVREKRGLAYTVNAAHQAYTDAGYFVAYAGVPHNKLALTIKLILKEFERVRAKGITKEELTRAKDNIRGKMAISLESSDEVAAFLGAQELLLGKIESPEEILAKIERITHNDIKRVAEYLFAPRNMRCAVIGPHKQESYAKLFKN